MKLQSITSWQTIKYFTLAVSGGYFGYRGGKILDKLDRFEKMEARKK